MIKRFFAVSILLVSFSTFSYEVINSKNTSTHDRERLRVTIIDNDANTKESRILTIKKAIEDITKSTPVMVITVDLIPSVNLDGAGALLAQGNYYADGCGASGKNCDDVKLSVKASDVKLTAKQIKIWEEVAKVNQELADKGIFDYDIVKKKVAKNLKIKVSEVDVPFIVRD